MWSLQRCPGELHLQCRRALHVPALSTISTKPAWLSPICTRSTPPVSWAIWLNWSLACSATLVFGAFLVALTIVFFFQSFIFCNCFSFPSSPLTRVFPWQVGLVPHWETNSSRHIIASSFLTTYIHFSICPYTFQQTVPGKHNDENTLPFDKFPSAAAYKRYKIDEPALILKFVEFAWRIKGIARKVTFGMVVKP